MPPRLTPDSPESVFHLQRRLPAGQTLSRLEAGATRNPGVQTTNPATNKSSLPPSSEERPIAVLKKETMRSQPLASGARWRRGVVALPLLFAGLLVALVFATAIGSVHISAGETTRILLNSTGLFHFRSK